VISLRDLQRDMLSFALGDRATAPGEWIVEGRLCADRRLGVYRNNAQIVFANAMQAAYPVLVRLSGEDWFNQTALFYQRMHASRSGDLNEVGREFADFLADTLQGGEHEYFVDVARLEWAYGRTLNQRAVGSPDFEGLDTITEDEYESLCFRINPTASLLESSYPTFAIWSSNQPEVGCPPLIRLNQGGSRILVIRRVGRVDVQELGPHAFALLRAFADGASLGAGFRSVIEGVGEFDLANVLGQLIGVNALIGLRRSAAGVSRVG